jgi:hypothetical protein
MGKVLKLILFSDVFSACDCHPIGSSGKSCNNTSGQCTCKEGVTGYQQTRSHVAPCVSKYQQRKVHFYSTHSLMSFFSTLSEILRVISMNCIQDTAPDSHHYDPTEVMPKTKNGKLMTILFDCNFVIQF